jgi:hypothetical protein
VFIKPDLYESNVMFSEDILLGRVETGLEIRKNSQVESLIDRIQKGASQYSTATQTRQCDIPPPPIAAFIPPLVLRSREHDGLPTPIAVFILPTVPQPHKGGHVLCRTIPSPQDYVYILCITSVQRVFVVGLCLCFT